ncbi:MAG: polysaccharide biosynthesis tyrosine autokinase, partial [Acidobacteriota bacterium]|nr:polysaccharide biosynthesis tyrosine autokinase [Acidobacteriota bacterium]
PATVEVTPPLPAFGEATFLPQGDVPLSAYWYVLLKRRWTVLVTTFLLTAIVAAISYFTTPIYQATARLEIEPETPQLQSQSSSDVYQKVDADDVFLQTQIQVLKSESLTWKTIEQLDLARNFGVVRTGPSLREGLDKHKVQLLGAFQRGLKVEQVPKTRMLAVSFENSDAQLAAKVATNLVENYLDYNFRQKDEAIRRSGWMDQQLVELKSNVEKSQQAVVTYERQNQIVNSSGKENVLEQMLGDLSRDMISAQGDRMQKETLYRQVLANRSEMASLVHDELLEKLEEKLADLKQQYTEALAQYGPNFPKAKRLKLEIDENQTQIGREQNRVISRMSNDYAAAYNREKLVSAGVNHQKEEVGKQNQLLVEDNLLRREFESNQQLYQSLLQRLKDASLSAALRSTNIHLVDSALVPNNPIRPRRLFNIVAAFWAGMILGVIGAFGQEMLDSSIKTAEEAEALMVTPALGFIPFERRSWISKSAFWKKEHGDRLVLSLTNRPNSSLSEAFRALGTAVAVPAKSIKTLLITSAQNGEGKTTTALNLAQALAQRRERVLIIDCDLRKGGIARSLGISNQEGVSTVLSSQRDCLQALQPLQPNLWVLPSGLFPANPVALLASAEMATMLRGLSARYDFVIVDSPPVLAVTDAAILAGIVDGVLLVTASGASTRGALMRSRRILVAAGARIVGIAVNKLDPRRPEYGSYAYYKEA